MTLLEAFLPAIRQQISGPLDFMMTDAALEAAITFCRESTIIRQEVILEGVTADQQYNLTDPLTQLQPFKRLSVWDYSYEEPDWSRNHHCYPDLISGVEYDVVSGNVLTFRKNYTKIKVLLAMRPIEGATEVPDILFDQYRTTIARGALEWLFMMPGKPWTDEQRSAYFKARFTDGFRDAYREALDNSPHTGFHNPVRRHEFF